MSISKIARAISESATLKLNEKAAILRAQGEPVIHLGGGEPKSRAPQDALDAAAKMLQGGEVRYTPADGIPALKQAIIRYTKQYYGHQVGTQNVIASSGAKQAIMVCLQSILDPQDEVILPVPYWVSYPDMVQLCGAVPVPVMPPTGLYEPRLEDIATKVGPRTRAVIINSPNNPSGLMYSPAFIQQIVEFCEERALYLIMDDIYQRLVFDSDQPVSCYEFAKDLGVDSRLVVVNGVSKQYAMTGFRIGWSIANESLTAVMTNIQSHQTSGPSALGQVASVGALEGDQSCVADLRRSLQSNRDALIPLLESFPGLEFARPDGTFYCFCDFSSYEADSTRLSNFLLDRVRVVTVPGVEFGMEGHLRLSFCGAREDLVEGIARIRWALDPASPRELSLGGRTVIRDWS